MSGLERHHGAPGPIADHGGRRKVHPRVPVHEVAPAPWESRCHIRLVDAEELAAAHFDLVVRRLGGQEAKPAAVEPDLVELPEIGVQIRVATTRRKNDRAGFQVGADQLPHHRFALGERRLEGALGVVVVELLPAGPLGGPDDVTIAQQREPRREVGDHVRVTPLGDQPDRPPRGQIGPEETPLAEVLGEIDEVARPAVGAPLDLAERQRRPELDHAWRVIKIHPGTGGQIEQNQSGRRGRVARERDPIAPHLGPNRAVVGQILDQRQLRRPGFIETVGQEPRTVRREVAGRRVDRSRPLAQDRPDETRHGAIRPGRLAVGGEGPLPAGGLVEDPEVGPFPEHGIPTVRRPGLVRPPMRHRRLDTDGFRQIAIVAGPSHGNPWRGGRTGSKLELGDREVVRVGGRCCRRSAKGLRHPGVVEGGPPGAGGRIRDDEPPPRLRPALIPERLGPVDPVGVDLGVEQDPIPIPREHPFRAGIRRSIDRNLSQCSGWGSSPEARQRQSGPDGGGGQPHGGDLGWCSSVVGVAQSNQGR